VTVWGLFWTYTNTAGTAYFHFNRLSERAAAKGRKHCHIFGFWAPI
jgi:hypothetical protein